MSGETRLIVMGLLERDATQRLGSRMQRGDTGVFDTLSQAMPCNVCVTLGDGSDGVYDALSQAATCNGV